MDTQQEYAESKGQINALTFSEAVYRAMVTATTKQKLELSDKDLEYFTNTKTIRNFCVKRSFEELLCMWAKLGHVWNITFAQNPKHLNIVLDCSEDQMDSVPKRANIIEAMARCNITAVNSNDIMMNLMILSVNSNTKSYAITAEANMLADNVAVWKKSMGATEAMSAQAVESYRKFVGLCLKILNSDAGMEAITGITNVKMKILMVLFTNQDASFNITGIVAETGVLGSKKLISQSLLSLCLAGHIITNFDLNPAGAKRGLRDDDRFMITATGIQIIMKYIEYIQKKALK